MRAIGVELESEGKVVGGVVGRMIVRVVERVVGTVGRGWENVKKSSGVRD